MAKLSTAKPIYVLATASQYIDPLDAMLNPIINPSATTILPPTAGAREV